MEAIVIKDYNEFNEIVDMAESMRIKYKINQRMSNIHLRLLNNKGFQMKHYIFSLTGLEPDLEPNIVAIAKELSKVPYNRIEGQYGYTEVKTEDKYRFKVKWEVENSRPFGFFEEYFANQDLLCYSYDINSSYPYAMTMPMPDTSKPALLNHRVGVHQIGFSKDGFVTTDYGIVMDYVFDLIESPFKEYVYKYYNLKKNSTGDEKQAYKYHLNIAYGLTQRHNIFIHNTIIYWATKYVRSYLDEDTIYSNVDSIVSLSKRTDLPLGDALGEFKCEHDGMYFKCAHIGCYQWKSKDGKLEVHYKGIPSILITDVSDISDIKENSLKLPYRIENNKIVKGVKHE